MFRLIRSVVALVVLLTALAGVPVALVALRGSPLPGRLAPRSVLEVLLRPDDGSVLLGLITAVAWLAWAVFALSVVAELVALLTRQRIQIRLPGLSAPQRVASGLILAVLTLAAAPAVPHVDPGLPVAQAAPPRTPTTPKVSPSAGLQPPKPAVAPARASTSLTRRTHLVRPGDDLWSLAERYYGEGRQWRRIATANPDLLTGGPDRLTAGWRLVIPQDEAADAHPTRAVEVRSGDTLSAIADRELGAADRWPELFRANRAQLSDPDELEVGIRLDLPGPARSQDHARRGPGRAAEEARDRPPTAAEARSPSEPSVGSRRTADRADPSEPRRVEPDRAEATAPGQDAGQQVEQQSDAMLPLGAVGGLLAAGLLTGLALRRRQQLQARPVGRRIPHPPPSARPVEVALGRRQRPMTLRSLDQALRAIGASCRAAQLPLPALRLALVGGERIEFVLAEPCSQAPLGFEVQGSSWVLDRSGLDYLRSVPGVEEALRPWPALVTLGRDRQDRQVLADLEALGLLELQADDPAAGLAVLSAMAVELSFSPWAEEMTLTLLGQGARLPEVLGHHGVQRAEDPEQLLQRLERRAADQRRHQPYEVLGQHRLDPDLADPWAPEIVLVTGELTRDQRRRLRALVCEAPRVTTAAVVLGGDGAEWSLQLDGNRDHALLQPLGLELAPQALAAEEAEAVVELIAATGTPETTAAPWWRESDEPDPPPDNVSHLGRRFGGWAAEAGEGDEMRPTAAGSGWDAVAHPTLMLLGPVELLGATGELPARAAKQCLEYCAWLLEFPGRSAHTMAAALAVAEGTRRSNMSRLRRWLGESDEGAA
ncbi:MAG: LysM peptidoglycan-binding domain-containing protein, partial [Friedmanniella sp.]